jgi:ribosomal protein S18 acetylase RimI-like enzyme
MRELAMLDENLRMAMRFFADATGSGQVEQFDSSLAIYSGLDYGVFNIGMLTGPIKAGPRGFEAQLSDCAKFYQSRSTRWSFWLCEEFLDSRTRKQSRQILLRSNLREISRAPAMIAGALTKPSKALPLIQCVPVTDSPTRLAFGELTAVCFDIPFTIAQSVYSPERGWKGSYRGYVGMSGGKPVAIIATVVFGGAIGIYSLGTLPEHRRHGYGEAMLRAAIDLCPPGLPIVLESTEAGYPLYRKLGFRELGAFTVYLTK